MNYNLEINNLNSQIGYFDDAINAISPSKIGYTELTSVIGPLLKVTHDTAKSIKLLADNNHFRDFIILSRPFIEVIINIGFICAEGNEAVLKSKKYAYQKGYRDLFRGLQINEFEIKAALSQHKIL